VAKFPAWRRSWGWWAPGTVVFKSTENGVRGESVGEQARSSLPSPLTSANAHGHGGARPGGESLVWRAKLGGGRRPGARRVSRVPKTVFAFELLLATARSGLPSPVEVTHWPSSRGVTRVAKFLLIGEK